MAEVPSEHSVFETNRVKGSIENWKRKLLDLTKRNRALNFKVNKVSTVTIVDEQPAEVFRQLYIQERQMRFGAAEDPEQPALPESASRLSLEIANNETHKTIDPDPEDIDEDEGLHHEFVPYESTSLESRYTDDLLQTTAQAEALDKSLRRIDEQARSSIEDQGVNPLFLALGMLHYTESNDSKQIFKAPLVLLPVELNRKSARSGYVIRATDEDPIINPALAEYLKQHSIELLSLPDSNNIPDDFDLQSVLSDVAERISNKKDWAVTTDIYLSLFSFQKFVMYKDLEANADPFSLHRLIRQLVLRSGSQLAGLPNEIRQMDLDTEYAPEKTFQVVDADSSQLRAIAACSRNYDLVVEGPPGTGKSQTITNLIAQALAVGKSVLFVAEKMAALEVVYRRMVEAGLGEACLELHSTKANKRSVMKEVAATLDASLQGLAGPTASTQRLPTVRHTLAEYVEAVHAPYGTLGISPFTAFGKLGQFLQARRFKLDATVEDTTQQQLDQIVRDLKDLAATSLPIGNPLDHPWRDSTRQFYTEDDLVTIKETARTLESKIRELINRSKSIESAYGFPDLNTLDRINTASEIAQSMQRSPGAPLEILTSEEWNAPPPAAVDLVARGRHLSQLRQHVLSNFKIDVVKQAHAEDIAYVSRKSEGILSFLAFLDGRYRAIKSRWRDYRLSSFQGSLLEQAEAMKVVDQYREEQQAIQNSEAPGQKLFGKLWQGENSSWDLLEDYVNWIVEFRGLCLKNEIASKIFERASQPAPEISDVKELQADANQTRQSLQTLGGCVGWPDSYLEDELLETIGLRARAIINHIDRGPQWAAFYTARVTVANGRAKELLPAAFSGEISFDELSAAFLRAFYIKWLSNVLQQRPPLARFNTLTHEQRVAEFKELDQRVLMENRAALIGILRERVQYKLQQPSLSEELPFLRKEMARQRKHAPLRRTMKLAGNAIRTIKPCFMMSPLTVAQLLDKDAPSFDLVVFDEASQLPPEDAVGAIGRSGQLIVVGDPKQLPPTNFFQVNNGLVNAQLDEDGVPIFEDSESILEDFMGAGASQSRLKWHYRSAHESLISFSNISFYDAELYTFPSTETRTASGGLQFEFIDGGVYEGKGLNQVEARRVADAVVAFAKEQLDCKERGEKVLSLGVGTFNLRQQLAIQDELEQRRRAEPLIDPFFARGLHEPFFVKNLENIQGDERDVIFISVTYAKAADGRLRYNFGPLNAQNGRRRLNVLITRARQRMRVFSSIRGDDINPAATSSDGPRLLREFLKYAETGRLESTIASLRTDADSPLETDILSELSKRGVSLVPQVGVGGYKIDLGVTDDQNPGRFICGIECDGVAYHASETARDRDRLRQQVLEARGWTIHRVWSTDWFKDRAGQIERLLSLIEAARTRAALEVAAEREARERHARETQTREQEERLVREHELETLKANTGNSTPYQRPVAQPYAFTTGESTYVVADFLHVPIGDLVKSVVHTIETEAPIHRLDLFTRVAGMWGSKAGQRIQARILSACEYAERGKIVERRGDFYWSISANNSCRIRSRAGTRIPGDRIAPEEYEAAILAILSTGHSFSETQLTSEVRSVLGFSRTGPVLDEAITAAILRLINEGTLGEGSTGIGLRRKP
jgi:very-short-patch-repair endonuclease